MLEPPAGLRKMWHPNLSLASYVHGPSFYTPLHAGPLDGAPPGSRASPAAARNAPEVAPSSHRSSPAPAPAGARAIAEAAPKRMRMLDLFSGSGNASRSALVRGWEVIRIDNAPGTAADIRADLASWDPSSVDGRRFDLVWASPPCTQLSTANNRTRDVAEGLVLVRAALRIIDHLKPRWWVLENVHGATRAIGDLIGPPVARYGSFYLWGVFPPFEANVPRTKTKLSGRRRAERRAAIPWAISDGLIRACEALAKELE